MCGIVDALLFDKLRQPSLGLRSCQLINASDYHVASGSLNLAQYIDAVPANVFFALNTYGTTLSGSARHRSPVSLIRHRNRNYIIRFGIRWQWFGNHNRYLTFISRSPVVNRDPQSGHDFLVPVRAAVALSSSCGARSSTDRLCIPRG